MKSFFRGSLATLVGSFALLVSSAALADGEACLNDIDCPGAECGGPVCNWTKQQGEKFTCNPAGTQTPKGKDGWCTVTADCKCAGVGAVCVFPYCTFTKASEAPAGAAGSGAGGAGAAGSPGAAGAPATAGAAPGAAGAPGAGGSAAKEEESSGCSVASPVNTGGGIALALGVVGLGVAFARRRR